MRYEDRPDYGTLKALLWDLLTNNGNVNAIYMFDWYREEEDNEENNDKGKTPEGGEINLLDITPGKNNSTSSNKGHLNVNKSEKNESPKKKGKHSSKKHDGSFSESGSESAGSSGDDKKAKKGNFNLFRRKSK